MRNVIKKSALALAICGTVIGPVQAQWVVTDPGNTAQAVEQVVQMIKQLAVMRQQYDQLMQTYQAISHAPQGALTQLGQKLNVDQFRNALPSQGALGAAMNGSDLGTGTFGKAASGYVKENRVHAPAGQDFQAKEMQRTANSVAGAQAMASGLTSRLRTVSRPCRASKTNSRAHRTPRPWRTFKPASRPSRHTSRRSKCRRKRSPCGRHPKSATKNSGTGRNAAGRPTS